MSNLFDEVSSALTNGTTAIVAEIDESWTVPVDTRLASALIFRRMRNEVLDEQLERESKAIAAEYQKLNEELEKAGEDTIAEIDAAVKKLEAKATIVSDQVKARLIIAKNEVDGKVNAIDEQMKDASEKRKAKMEKRIDELTTEYIARTERLKAAAKLVSQAFGSKQKLKKSEKDFQFIA